jgi:hypothetical protein
MTMTGLTHAKMINYDTVLDEPSSNTAEEHYATLTYPTHFTVYAAEVLRQIL